MEIENVDIQGVPLVLGNDQGQTIGSAIVTLKDGLWSAAIQLTDESIKQLGIELTFESLSGVIEHRHVLVAKPHEDVDFVRELRKRWR